MRLCSFLVTGLILPLMAFAISDEEFSRIQQALRKVECPTVKSEVTSFDDEKPLVFQISNGDEATYADKRASFNKGLSHQPSGFPNVQAFNLMVKALQTGSQADFNAIPIGIGVRKLANPQASLAFSLAANDSWLNTIPPAPSFSSAETAGEMVEVYCTALVRDVAFNAFDSDSTVAEAIGYLNQLTDFRGPKVNGQVTPDTFLRGNTPGDLIGPYISQFLYLSIDYGNATIHQNMLETPMATMDNDFLTTFGDWLTVQNGGVTGKAIILDDEHFIRTPRDLTEYVHQDTPGQASLSALLILQSFVDKYGATAFDPNNPYNSNPTQEGFVTFNISHVLSLVRNAVHEGLKAAWYHKWQVNRRLRPEEYGFYVHEQITNGAQFGIHPDLINSPVLPSIMTAFGSYFLPTAYPEGSPVHPSYPAGHATFIGAAVTILKAFFNEDFEIPDPMMPNDTNTKLEPFTGALLTVGGELNKLAANISLGRDHAGVHYRSDGAQGMLLGEKVAIDVLNNDAFLFHEDFAGFHLTKFDGTKIIVGAKKTTQ
ncbi:MAG: vanadium-dependent haloperoxidase [Chlamydiota bacterium]